mmetsp:Transcript_9922/g.20751  ORF Transcript_9922/g.20751 Transcript_9922/m.20751 type:complete len:219 (-) Transcript_9922:1266-1922(-)
MKREIAPNNNAVDLNSIGPRWIVASSSSLFELIKMILTSTSGLLINSLTKVSRFSEAVALSNLRLSIAIRQDLPSSSSSIRSRHSSASSSVEMSMFAFVMSLVYSTRSAKRVSSSGTTPRATGSQKTSSNGKEFGLFCTYRQTEAARELLPMPRIPPNLTMSSTRSDSRTRHMSTSRPIKCRGNFGRILRASSSMRLSVSSSSVFSGTSWRKKIGTSW